ncbi:MAG: peptidoglycan-associated lipoprotein Pal [Syntrophorhabdaceae bacterium]|nr:peptidoglycan-associated lipoprotein Pal [Syntrophorhabdaceae bacterium]
MKSKFFGLILMVLIVGIFLSYGCSQQVVKADVEKPKAPEVQVVVPKTEEVKKEEPPPQVVEKEVPKAVPVAKPTPPPKLNDIFFDFDKYNIRPNDAETLKQNLDWFIANKGVRVRIEGHCDERGTVEYNLVLGQKRADATKNYLVNLGVDEKLLETVSYGKERPFDPGHNEEAWAKNRRAHFLILK